MKLSWKAIEASALSMLSSSKPFFGSAVALLLLINVFSQSANAEEQVQHHRDAFRS
jgi:hypothetical protein